MLRESEDPRDLTLRPSRAPPRSITCSRAGKRVFYGDTLCVDPDARRRQIAYGLVAAQIPVLRSEGFAYRIGRTAMNATAMRGLFAKLGFEELPVRDAVFPERTYWLLTL